MAAQQLRIPTPRSYGGSRPSSPGLALSLRAPAAAESPLTGNLSTDLDGQISNITVGELLYMLGHIQKLSAQAPHAAQSILAEHPQLCHSLLHAECLVGMIDEDIKLLLPMSGDDLRRARKKAKLMKDQLAKGETVPMPVAQESGSRESNAEKTLAFGSASRAVAEHSGAVSKSGAQARPPVGGSNPPLMPKQPPHPPPGNLEPSAAAMPMPTTSKAPAAAPAAAAPSLPGTEGQSDSQKQELMRRLVQMTPDQIEKLPEATKVQVLQFLQQQGQ